MTFKKIILTLQVIIFVRLMSISMHQKLLNWATWGCAPWKRSSASRTTSILNATQDSLPSFNKILMLTFQSNKPVEYKVSKRSCNYILKKVTKLKLSSWHATYLIGIFITKATGTFLKRSSSYWLPSAYCWPPSWKKTHPHHSTGW